MIDFKNGSFLKLKKTNGKENAGMLDLDSELDITILGLGTIRFEFTGASDIVQIGKLIASFTL